MLIRLIFTLSLISVSIVGAEEQSSDFDPQFVGEVDNTRAEIRTFLETNAPEVNKIYMVVKQRPSSSSESTVFSAQDDSASRIGVELCRFLIPAFKSGGLTAELVTAAPETGNHAVLTLNVNSPSDQSKVTVDWDLVVSTRSAKPQVMSTESSVTLGLSTAAYSGLFSFEARRWSATPGSKNEYALNNIDLPTGPVYLGLDAEVSDFEQLTESRLKPRHPLNNPEFPYGVEIEINERAAKSEMIDGQMFVAMEENDRYAIRLSNDSPRYVLAALYVDGINTINRSRKLPHFTKANENWFLSPGYRGKVSGWSNINGRTGNSEDLFYISSDKSLSIAETEGKPDRIGTITAVFYAFELEPSPTLPVGRGGTAAGEKLARKYQFDTTGRKKDVFLAAVSLHYRTAEEIAALRSKAGGQAQQFVTNGRFESEPVIPKELAVPETVAYGSMFQDRPQISD